QAPRRPGAAGRRDGDAPRPGGAPSRIRRIAGARRSFAPAGAGRGRAAAACGPLVHRYAVRGLPHARLEARGGVRALRPRAAVLAAVGRTRVDGTRGPGSPAPPEDRSLAPGRGSARAAEP